MKKVLLYILTFALLVLLCTLLLVAAAMIPRNRIQPQLVESAEILTEREDCFIHVIEGVDSSIWDDIADANLLNIANYWNTEHPLESVLWSGMYYGESLSKKESLKIAVTEDVPANEQYLRYWHGSLLFVRPLLLILNLRQIYVLHYIVITALFLWLLAVLFRNHMRSEGLAMIIAMVAVSIWFVPMCLEYTWMFLMMFVVSIGMVKLALEKRYKHFGILFFIVGILTIFFDFFTTELLTILVPLLLTLRIRERQDCGGNWIFAMKCCIMWGIGYVSMWIAKWGLSAIILKTDVRPYLDNNIAWHLTANAGMSRLQYYLSVFLRNILCLFPIGYGPIGAGCMTILITVFIFVPVVLGRIRLKKTIEWNQAGLYFLIGMIPYIRYLIIHHHVWYHYFFTYRAQAASVLALCFFLLELVEIKKGGENTCSLQSSCLV